MEDTYTSEVFKRVAAAMGVKIRFEPECGLTGELVFPNGKRHLFKHNNPNINASVSVEIARDKELTHYFLRARGIANPKSVSCGADDGRGVDAAARFAAGAGYPVFVKPNNLGEGCMVFKVHHEAELRRCAAGILEANATVVVEELCVGNDYRVVTLDGKILSAYQRLPLSVIGNGVDDVNVLLAAKQLLFPSIGRPAGEINLGDSRIDASLARIGRTRSHVPARGERVQLLDNANLSTGGDSVDHTGSLHPSFAAIATRTADALGLRLSGVDLMCADLTAPAGEQTWNVIEVNGEPDLDNYAAAGREQEERLAAMYRKVLLAIISPIQ